MSEPTEIKPNLGGRPRLPDAPETAEDCRRLIAKEATKTQPNATRSRLLAELLNSFERQDAQQAEQDKQKLAQLAAENSALKTEIESVRTALKQERERSAALTVERTEFEELKAECARLSNEVSGARTARDIARRACETAITARDLAVAAQQQAEQNEAHVRQHLTAGYSRLIEPLQTMIRALHGASSLDAREKRYQLSVLLDEFRNLHSLAMKPVAPPAPASVKTVRANPEAIAKAIEDKTEQDRLENLKQPRTVDAMHVEHFRERAVPRTPEPEPTKPISGAADFADWV